MAADDLGDEFSREVFYGQFEAAVVGCRYYEGIAHAGEYVTLVREPNNPYDPNAVRVDNFDGKQVGHIKRGTAAALRRILDHTASGGPRVEATIPRDLSNIFTMPVTLALYGTPGDMSWVVENLRLAGHVLRRGGAALPGGPSGSGAYDSTEGGGGRGALGVSYEFNPARAQRELDELFDKLASEQAGASTDSFVEPPQLTSSLREHQKRGVAWMLSRERQAPNVLPTFFEERLELGRQVFYNSVTSTSTTARPSPVFGGLLADDMGNGKTLQTLAVILSNPPTGVVYECPSATLSEAAQTPGHAAAIADAKGSEEDAPVPTATTSSELALSNVAPAFASTWREMFSVVREVCGRVASDSCDLQTPLTLAQLRTLCQVSAVSKSGNKDALAARAWAALAKVGGPASLLEGASECQSNAPFIKTWVQMLDRARELWGRELSTERDLLLLKVNQLRELCVVSCVSKSGNKDALAARAWAALDAAGGTAALYAGNAVAPRLRELQPTAKRRKTSAQSTGRAKRLTTAPAAACARGTLIVAPVSVLENWATQIEEHIAHGTLTVVVWHGPGRHALAPRLREADVVITSYSTLSGELADHEAYLDACSLGAKPAPPPGVLSVRWHRAVLDEAHTVRNRQTKAFKAVCALHARLRWALTGTPIQNSAGDVYGVLAFLGAQPLNEPQIFNRAVARPIREGDRAGLARLRLLLKTISLRRPKSVLGAELPPKTIVVQKVVFDLPHRESYSTLFDSARVAIAAAIELGTATEHYMSILECIMRLRQACCARSLVPPERLDVAAKMLAAAGKARRASGGAPDLSKEEVANLFTRLKRALDDGEDDFECAICLQPQSDVEVRILRNCSHSFCKPCIMRVMDVDPRRKQQTARCPMCRQDFRLGDLLSIAELEKRRVANDGSAGAGTGAEGPPAASETTPPKVAALLECLEGMRAEGPDKRAVVFSQFTSFLDIIEASLKSERWTTARIDGSRTAEQRAAAMHALRDGTARVLLVSTRAGGQGLNLTTANRVFMMDLWWNEAVEAQAWDRVHRLGQTLPVTVTRFGALSLMQRPSHSGACAHGAQPPKPFTPQSVLGAPRSHTDVFARGRAVTEDTLEEKLLELQEAKAAIGSGALRKLSPAEAAKARTQDLRRLFSISEQGD